MHFAESDILFIINNMPFLETFFSKKKKKWFFMKLETWRPVTDYFLFSYSNPRIWLFHSILERQERGFRRLLIAGFGRKCCSNQKKNVFSPFPTCENVLPGLNFVSIIGSCFDLWPKRHRGQYIIRFRLSQTFLFLSFFSTLGTAWLDAIWNICSS